ncbi:MAG: hypothetical protein IKY18_03880 [Oscillospiraceae bacterium]|nr:hypothetical protein [Oscillospiraceae bacterium]
MAKKYEFRPDKPKFSLLTYLILSPNQRRKAMKWGAYTAFLVFLSVLQDVVLSQVRIFGATTELIPCAIFLICIMEGVQLGSVFALISSLLYLFSGTAPGVYSMVAIVFCAVGACVVRQAYLQERFSSAMISTSLAMVCYVLTNFIFGLFLGLTIWSRFHGFIITAILSLLAVPVFYPIFKAIGKIGGQLWKD